MYHYQDIVAVQTVTSPWARSRSAEAAHTVVGLRAQGHPNHDIHLQETGIEFVIDVLRRLLRERKAIGPRP